MIEPLADIQPKPSINRLSNPAAKPQEDPKAISKQIETVFLTELLKNIFEQTEFGKNKAISPFIPFFTSEMATAFSERGIGIGDFLSAPERLKNSQDLGGHTPRQNIQPISGSSNDMPLLKAQYKASGWEKNTNTTEILSPQLLQGLPITLKLPAKGRISSNFGLRIDPFEGRLKQHNGIDIALEEGTEIKASAPGKVVFSGEARGYGKVVIIEHEGGISTLYGHNSLNLVKKGDTVKGGQFIALSGSTGRATGPHLHFEVRKDGEAVDPSFLIG